MATTYTFILRDCPAANRDTVAQFLGKAFSLKEGTCGAIAGSAPIVLLQDLTREEAAAMTVALSGFQRLGATIEFTTQVSDELPKIDWPRRPQVFKRDIGEHVADLRFSVSLPTGGSALLIDLLIAKMVGGSLATQSPAPHPTATPPPQRPGTDRVSQEFRGIQLPEITPFSNPVLPTGSGGVPVTGGDDPMSRLNELFPEEDGGFIPNNQDITNILNRLLPDEEASTPTLPSSHASSGVRVAVNGAAAAVQVGWSVFLAKIADDARRAKAVPLIAELLKIAPEEAEALSKKVIIPVLKGATKEDADAAKQRFAKIGILARVKGPEA